MCASLSSTGNIELGSHPRAEVQLPSQTGLVDPGHVASFRGSNDEEKVNSALDPPQTPYLALSRNRPVPPKMNPRPEL